MNAFIVNAQLYCQIQELAEQGKGPTFSDYLWSFVGGKPIVNAWKEFSEVPATTPESDAMSKSLKKMGFKFTGSTICYAFMQSMGMVNDHVVDCFCYSKKS